MEKIKILALNKKARFNYDITETLECGIVLHGTEVKSIKMGKFSFSDSYIRIKNGDLELVGFNISLYPMSSLFNHEPDRIRKLLAHKQEIKKLTRKVEEKGFSLTPIKVYLKKGLVKIEIGLGKGKKIYDKRQTIKNRDLQREAERDMRSRN